MFFNSRCIKISQHTLFVTLLFLSLTTTLLNAQTPVVNFEEQDIQVSDLEKFQINKKIPESIKKQVLIALSYYPELKDLNIIFRIKKTKTPLTSRPRFFDVFKKKKNRTYVITISSSSNKALTPILFDNLPFNAQIGVIGHELAHIVEYNTKSSLEIVGLLFKLMKPSFVDSFEFNTDKRAITQGLGYQLLDWSKYVREALSITEWKGASNLSNDNPSTEGQRYMNPETIKKYIEASEIY